MFWPVGKREEPFPKPHLVCHSSGTCARVAVVMHPCLALAIDQHKYASYRWGSDTCDLFHMLWHNGSAMLAAFISHVSLEGFSFAHQLGRPVQRPSVCEVKSSLKTRSGNRRPRTLPISERNATSSRPGRYGDAHVLADQ